MTREQNKEWREEILRKVQHIRCPECNRKFEVCNEDDEMGHELVRSIPRHKSY